MTMLLKIVLAMALMAPSTLAICNPGKSFDDDTGEPCAKGPAAPAKERRATPAAPRIVTEDGHVYVYSAGGAAANLTDMQSAAGATELFEQHAGVQRRAAGDMSTVIQELVDTNKAVIKANSAEMKEDRATFVAAVGTVVTALDAIRKEQKEVAQAAATAGAGGCIPYVEYAVKGGCKLLSYSCDKFPGTWEKARPTRTTDRKCEKWSACELKKTYETVKGTTYSDRKCGKVTECDAKKGEGELTAPTLTSDRTCGSFGQTKEGPVLSCLWLLQQKKDTKSGHYWIKPKNGEARRTYCDMKTDGGGWTMFGRGKGRNGRCWRTSGDCYHADLGNDKLAWQNGNTAKMSDAWVNGMTYKRIRMSGTNTIKGNQYWRGKDDGGCTYRHLTVSSGKCNCAARNVGMSGTNCGSVHSSHRGVGDWGRVGCLHSTHYNENWYFRTGSNCHSGGDHCSGTGRHSSGCDIQMWVR